MKNPTYELLANIKELVAQAYLEGVLIAGTDYITADTRGVRIIKTENSMPLGDEI